MDLSAYKKVNIQEICNLNDLTLKNSVYHSFEEQNFLNSQEKNEYYWIIKGWISVSKYLVFSFIPITPFSEKPAISLIVDCGQSQRYVSLSQPA